MKKILFIFIAALVITGCNRNSDPDLLFGKLPEERIGQRNAELKEKLISSSGGWKGFLKTSLHGGGYAFYLQFNADETVSMMGDLTETSASEVSTSTYRIKHVMNTSIIFDTYNYISLLQDPDASAFGGEGGKGMQSDIEFEYIRGTEDSIVLKGKRYQNYFYLTKATDAERAKFEAGSYLDAITAFDDYFSENPNAYIEVDKDGVKHKLGLEFDVDRKRINGLSVFPGDSVVNVTDAFAWAIDGAYLAKEFRFLGNAFTYIKVKSANSFAVIDSTGKEYTIKHSNTPLAPLHALLGAKYELQAIFKTINPGTSTTGSEIIGHYVNNLDNRYSGYRFTNGTLTFSFDLANKRLTLTGWHNQSGNGGWNTKMVYDYEKSTNGVYTFTYKSGPSGGYVAKLMTEDGKKTIDDFLRNNKVKFDYHVVDGVVYGKMSSVDNPDIVITLNLSE